MGRRRQYDIWEVIRRNAPKCTCQGTFNPYCPVIASLAEYGAKPQGVARDNKIDVGSVKRHADDYFAWCDAEGQTPDPMIVLNVVTWGPRDLRYVPH